MEDKQIKGCLTSLAIYVLFLGVVLLCFLALSTWKERHPVNFCDETEQDKIEEYSPKICKLRYPILNADEIKALKNKNEELEDKVSELEYKLKDIKDTIEDEKEPDNWQPDPPQRDF